VFKTLELKTILVLVPLQIVAFATFVVNTGVGFTVTMTLTPAPTHPFSDGVTLYVTCCIPVEVLVNHCTMESFEPAKAPIILLLLLTVHPKLIPGIFPENKIPVVVPLQMV
jgi:hypothetical protein